MSPLRCFRLGTTSLPQMDKGGVMVMIDCDVENGGTAINEDFIVDFGQEPNGPSRCHRLATRRRLHNDIWL